MNKFVSMEDPYVIVLRKLYFLFLITILVSSSSYNARTSTTIITAIAKPTRLVTKLIHRDSILSPYYNNHNVTISESERVIQTLMARYTYLKERTKRSSTMDDDDDNVQAGLIPNYDSFTFLVNFSIGQPPVPQLVVMETGSDLLWVQCLPCINCFDQQSDMFDPSKSSTYENLSCNSPYCVFDSFEGNCDSLTSCPYYYKHADASTTRGDLGLEELRFMTSNEGTTSVLSNVMFGCGHENHGFNIPKKHNGFNGIGFASGILGLGPSKKLSLVWHLGSRFSYCIGSISDADYEHNQLIIGDDGAKIEGYPTPIQVFDNLYYLTLEGISVGEKLLDIDPHTFIRDPSSGEGGVVIDTGTTLIILDRRGYIPLSEEVQSLIGGMLQKSADWSSLGRLCYMGEVSTDLKGFPVVTFHFDGGAELALEAEAMFEEHYEMDEFCMAVVPTGFQDLNVIGIRAQQYYNVAYDLADMKLYFQRIDCEVLD